MAALVECSHISRTCKEFIIKYSTQIGLLDKESELMRINTVRFEVFTAVTMKNGVFWDVTPCDSCKNRRF
jgi:hypothetical protein